MRIDILTLFPETIESYLNSSILKRALSKDIVEIYLHNFRDFADNKHSKVDDTPYGGGAGMLLMLQPIVDCLKSIPGYDKALKILTSARGEVYAQKTAQKIAKEKHVIIICGHYEGYDERILNYVDIELSIGDYIMTGGEIASLVLVDSIVRLLPAAIKESSLLDESFNHSLLEYDQYTKPALYDELAVPEVLTSGNHEEIRKYRLYSAIKKTYLNRPDLLEKYVLNKEESYFLEKIKKGEEY